MTAAPVETYGSEALERLRKKAHDADLEAARMEGYTMGRLEPQSTGPYSTVFGVESADLNQKPVASTSPKPCPACEGSNVIVTEIFTRALRRDAAMCRDCYHTGSAKESREAALAAWNALPRRTDRDVYEMLEFHGQPLRDEINAALTKFFAATTKPARESYLRDMREARIDHDQLGTRIWRFDDQCDHGSALGDVRGECGRLAKAMRRYRRFLDRKIKEPTT